MDPVIYGYIFNSYGEIQDWKCKYLNILLPDLEFY